MSFSSGNQGGGQQTVSKRAERREAKTKQTKHDRTRFNPKLFSFSLSPVQRARKFSAVLGTTSSRSCLYSICALRGRGERVSARRRKKGEEGGAVVKIAGHSIGIVEKKGFPFSLSLSPAATTHRHLDAAQRGAIGGDVKEDDGVGHFDGRSVVEEEEEEGRRRWFWRRE